MTAAQIKKAKELAERLKKKKKIKNPHALARYLVKRKSGEKK